MRYFVFPYKNNQIPQKPHLFYASYYNIFLIKQLKGILYIQYNKVDMHKTIRDDAKMKIKLIKYTERHPEEVKFKKEVLNENIDLSDTMTDDEKLELAKDYKKSQDYQEATSEENDIIIYT